MMHDVRGPVEVDPFHVQENHNLYCSPEVHPPKASMLTWVRSLCGPSPAARIVVGGVNKRLHLLLCTCTNVHVYFCGIH